MRSRLVIGFLFFWTLASVVLATTGDAGPRYQSAIVSFEHPTWVTNQLLVGTYVIVHDEDKMARGEPCTTIYRVGSSRNPLEEVVSFHCIPRKRLMVSSFTTTVNSNPVLGTDTLTEYQFAGESQGHGVPLIDRGSNRLGVRDRTTCVD